MKQTNNAIKFLMAQYRAIFNNAYFKGLASAALVTVTMAAGQAHAADDLATLLSGTTADTPADSIVITADDSSVSGASGGFIKGITVQSGTLSFKEQTAHVRTNGVVEIQSGATLTLSGSNNAYSGLMGTFDDKDNFESAPNSQLLVKSGGTVNVTKSQIQMSNVTLDNATVTIGTNIGDVTSDFSDNAQINAVGNAADGTGIFSVTGSGSIIKLNSGSIVNANVFNLADGKIEMAGSGSSGNYAVIRAFGGESGVVNFDGTDLSVSDSGNYIGGANVNFNNSGTTVTIADNAELHISGALDKGANNDKNIADAPLAGTINFNDGTLNLSGAGSKLIIDNADTVFNVTGGTIANSGTITFNNKTVNTNAKLLGQMITGTVEFAASGSVLNLSDASANLSSASGAIGLLKDDGTLNKATVTNDLTIKGQELVLGSALAQDKLTVEAGTVKVTSIADSGAKFDLTSGAILALNGLTSATETNVKTFNVSGTSLTLGQDASAHGSVSKIDNISVAGQSGALAVNGTWDLKDSALTLSGSGAAALTNANVTLKSFDVQSGGLFTLDNSSLSVSDTIKTAEAADGTKGLNLANNSTLSANFAKVTSGSGAAAGIATLKLDGTSTLVLTGREAGEISLADLNAYKEAFLGQSGSGLFKIDGATLSAADSGISGDTVAYDKAQSGAGLAGIYDKVTVTGVDTSTTAMTSTNDWGAAQLATGQDTIKLGDAGALTLHGVDGKLVTTADGKAGSVTLSGSGSTLNIVGTGTLESVNVEGTPSGGKFLIGSSANVTVNKDVGATATAVPELTIQDQGALKAVNVYATTLTVDGALVATGDVKAASGAAISGNVEVLGEGKSFASSENVAITGSLKATAFNLETADKQVSVGDATSSGFLEVGSLNLSGGKLLLDPAWGEKATLAFVDQTGKDTVNVSGSVGVGQNAAFFAGSKSDSADAQAILARYTDGNGSLDKDGVGALFIVNKTYELVDQKAVLVDPSKVEADLGAALTTANTFTVAKGGALVVTDELTQKIANNTSGAVINFAGNNGALTLEAGSLVQFDSALTADDTVNLVSGTGANVTNNGTNNIFAANGLLEGALNGTTVEFTLNEDKVRALSNMSRPVQDLVIDTLQKGTKFDKDANGAQYIIAVNGDKDGKTLEATTRLAVYGGAVHGTSLAQSAATDAVSDRMSRSNPNGSLVFADNAQGGGLWLSPVYKSHESDSFESDGVEYGVDGDLTGLVLGADSTSESGVRVGGYFNFGSYDFDGQGVGDQVSNEADYFGFGLYAGMSVGQFSLLADAGFTQVSNDIEQSINYKNFDKATADVDSSAVTLGLRGEYKLSVASMDVTPHLGVRYTRLAIDNYDTKVDGYQVASTDFDTMQMFSIPFGVTVSKDIAAGAWTIKPVFDLTLTANAGDTDAEFSTFYTGTRAVDLTSEAFDSFTYGATFGIDAKYGENFSIGLNTNYTGSSNADEFGVMGNARYMF